MKQALKRDWEIVRIFLILAVLTVGFVWGVQGLILTPTATPHIRSYNSTGSTPADMGPHRDVVVLGKLGIYPRGLSLSLPERHIPSPVLADPSRDKETESAKGSHK